MSKQLKGLDRDQVVRAAIWLIEKLHEANLRLESMLPQGEYVEWPYEQHEGSCIPEFNARTLFPTCLFCGEDVSPSKGVQSDSFVCDMCCRTFDESENALTPTIQCDGICRECYQGDDE